MKLPPRYANANELMELASFYIVLVCHNIGSFLKADLGGLFSILCKTLALWAYLLFTNPKITLLKLHFPRLFWVGRLGSISC